MDMDICLALNNNCFLEIARGCQDLPQLPVATGLKSVSAQKSDRVLFGVSILAVRNMKLPILFTLGWVFRFDNSRR